MNFTENQKTAINCLDENLQIIACAGSGKTQVISQRIINLILSGKAEPRKIIAFTYTDKAAAELKARVLKLAREQIGNQLGLADMYIGTIHAWCLNVLQDSCLEYQKFDVLDEVKQALFINRTFKRNGMLDLGMEKYKDTQHFTNLMSLVRESEVTADLPDAIKQALEKYESALKDSCWFDFTMILSEVAWRLQEDASFRSRLSERLRYLIVDEYQDVNPIQERIIRGLWELGLNICVVGDDDQTIYQWRGGDVRYILDFERRYSMPGKSLRQVHLEDNFRSSPAVIESARVLIEQNAQRLRKRMVAAGHQSYELGDLLVHDFDDQASEAEWIAATITQLRGISFHEERNDEPRGLDYSDMVVLLRKWKKAESLVEAFTCHEIPFVVAGVNHLFLQPEARAARAIYEYLDKKLDADTLLAMWREVLPGITDAAWRRTIAELGKKMPGRIRIYHDMNLQAIFWEFLENAGVTESALMDAGGEGHFDSTHGEIVLYNLGMFSQAIQDFETIHFTDGAAVKLGSFLNFLRYSGEGIYPEGWLNNAYKSPNAVRIMTVHQSKGLEFPVVFIPGLNKNYFPAQKIGGKSVWHFIDSSLIAGAERYRGSVEDERRLMYVAMTRAKKFLFLSRSPTDKRNDQVPSQFIAEAQRGGYLVSSPSRDFSERPRATPRPGQTSMVLELDFSKMKTLFDCPWSFKFFWLYGFSEPLNQRLGYGRTLHNVLMEMHRAALEGHMTSDDEIAPLLAKHESFPYALGDIWQAMHDKTEKYLDQYLRENRADFPSIKYSEKEIQLDLGDGVLINGRIDLVRRRDESGRELTCLVDFKSREEVQTKRLSMQQLYLYALGYEALTGEKADLLEIFDLERDTPETEEVLEPELTKARERLDDSVRKIRELDLDQACEEKGCTCRLKG
jgi:DNA helicase-2/ATP-dependent DNA helicase PcrA